MPSSNVHKRPDDEWDDILDYMDEIHEYLSDKAHYRLKELEAFEFAIDNLPIRERTVLTARYIAGMEFSEILKKVPISERSLYLAHRKGLELIDMTELDKLYKI